MDKNEEDRSERTGFSLCAVCPSEVKRRVREARRIGVIVFLEMPVGKRRQNPTAGEHDDDRSQQDQPFARQG